MAEPMTFTPDESGPDPEPGKSTILFSLINGDSDYAPGLELDEYHGAGGSWEIEGLCGMQAEAIHDIISEADVDLSAGWWIIEGFFGHFTNYEGEVDCDFTFDVLRVALATEIIEWPDNDL